MIESKTGSIEVAGQTILPHCTELEFLTTGLGKSAKRSESSKGWVIYDGVADEKLSVAFRFKDARLAEVELRFKNNKRKSWDDWSESSEKQLKRKHDEWLEKLLGKPPHKFTWGDVLSIYDQRSGASSIIVRYRSI